MLAVSPTVAGNGFIYQKCRVKMRGLVDVTCAFLNMDIFFQKPKTSNFLFPVLA